MIEDILKDLYTSDNEWEIALLRYFNPIGAHKSGKIGEDPNDIPNNLMTYITQVAVGKLKELSVFGNDYDTHDGTGVRDYIHIVDLAKGHIAALSKLDSFNKVESINLGTGKDYSVLDLVNAFKEVNSVKIPYKIATRRDGDIATCYADLSYAKEMLGWEAIKSLEDMCKNAWKWQSKNHDGYEGK